MIVSAGAEGVGCPSLSLQEFINIMIVSAVTEGFGCSSLSLSLEEFINPHNPSNS